MSDPERPERTPASIHHAQSAADIQRAAMAQWRDEQTTEVGLRALRQWAEELEAGRPEVVAEAIRAVIEARLRELERPNS